MKRNNLTTAVLASIAGIAGIAGSAQAVNVNPDGLGQVLLYPFYTTNNGNQTLLSVVNTTDQAKAVKVRFLESLNSREVLDFNLYMSAYDVWTAAIFDNAAVPTLITLDSTCTVPYFYGNGGGTGVQQFLNFAYTGDSGDASPEISAIGRASEGHFEIIEMGEMYGGSAVAATHVQPGSGPNQQLPANCQTLVDAWSILGGVNGYWIDDNTIDISAPTGGLFGGAAIVNAGEGLMFSYDAKAINGFWDPGVSAGFRHSNPGDELPSLTSGDDAVANIFDDAGNAITLTYGQSIEAVSALFMHDSVMNEYALVESLAAQSEWVITFPTKRFYTDPSFAIGLPPVAPFTAALNSTATACEDFTIDYWDREEGQLTVNPGDVLPPPSPRPDIPDAPVNLFELCAETNIMRFDHAEEPSTEMPLYDGNAIDATPILGTSGFGSLVTFVLPLGYDAGWAKVDMVSNVDAAGVDAADRMDSEGLLGLPVIGNWFEAFTNGTLEGGAVLANYGGIFEHKGTRAQTTTIIQ